MPFISASKSTPDRAVEDQSPVYTPLMAQPARHPEVVDESLELDPVAVQRAYRAASSEAARPPPPSTGDQARQASLLARPPRARRRQHLPEHRHLAPDRAHVRFVDTSTTVEPSEPYPPERPPPPEPEIVSATCSLPLPGGIWAAGERVTALAGLVLMLSTFMGWYAGSDEGPTIAVIGWHTGAIGKLVFLLGLAVVVLVVLRELGIELPRDRPGEPRHHRHRLAGDDPRPHPADLGARPLLPVRRPRDRDLDRAHCCAGPDRRRPSASRRRAVATARPRTAPPRTSSG